jgi:phosphoesterase RecJ-like protein
MEKFYPEFAEAFARLLGEVKGRQVAIVGHSRPDGDCIGSQVGLGLVLASKGARTVYVNSDPVPRRLSFLTEGIPFIGTDEAVALSQDCAAVFVDCADHARAGERLKSRFAAPLASVDHHLSNAGFAQINLIDPASAATSEILAGMVLDQGLEIDERIARALYTGILTDTGQFRFNSTSRRCFFLAGELVVRGASPSEAGYQLYERESAGKLQLLQRYLASLRLECDGRICIGTLPNGVFAETGTTAEDTEGLVDYARSIDSVDVGVLIEERTDGVKASLRAKDPAYRMDLVAGQFNGGGHACAAGLNLKGSAAGFRERLVAALTERLHSVDAERGR